MANLLEDTVGGIAIPYALAAGFGVDLETTVADLMQVEAFSGGILSSMGTLLSGITAGSSGGFSGAGMLQAVGVSGNTVKEIARGTGLKAGAASGATVSQSTFIGNNRVVMFMIAQCQALLIQLIKRLLRQKNQKMMWKSQKK